jgi:hypothetical protein
LAPDLAIRVPDHEVAKCADLDEDATDAFFPDCDPGLALLDIRAQDLNRDAVMVERLDGGRAQRAIGGQHQLPSLGVVVALKRGGRRRRGDGVACRPRLVAIGKSPRGLVGIAFAKRAVHFIRARNRTDECAPRTAGFDHKDTEPRRGRTDIGHDLLRCEIIGDLIGTAHPVGLAIEEEDWGGAHELSHPHEALRGFVAAATEII